MLHVTQYTLVQQARSTGMKTEPAKVLTSNLNPLPYSATSWLCDVDQEPRLYASVVSFGKLGN